MRIPFKCILFLCLFAASSPLRGLDNKVDAFLKQFDEAIAARDKGKLAKLISPNAEITVDWITANKVTDRRFTSPEFITYLLEILPESKALKVNRRVLESRSNAATTVSEVEYKGESGITAKFVESITLDEEQRRLTQLSQKLK